MATFSISTFISKLRRGVGSIFSGSLTTSGGVRGTSRVQMSWDDYDARMGRYELFSAMAESTTFDKAHGYLKQLRIDKSLYPAVRNLANPTARLVEFWATHLMGGYLDPKAGDGSMIPSALPIIGASDRLRESISTLWLHSRWQDYKTLLCRYGSSMGDVGIETYDDIDKGRVCHRIIDPRWVSEYKGNDQGNCLGYTIERWCPDPRENQPITGNINWVIYREVVEKVEGGVLYRLFLDEDGGDSTPYDWGQGKTEWVAPYPFVPFVWVNHTKWLADSQYGAPEAFPALDRLLELDDVSSRISDGFAKAIQAPWLYCGVQKPAVNVEISGVSPTTGNVQPARGEVPALWGPPDSKAQALVTDFHPAEALKYLETMLDWVKEDFPELRRDNEWAYGDASGKALRVARQRVEAKAIERRSRYDTLYKQAIQQAVAIGGARGYEGYEGFDFGSYDRGDLDFYIGPRSVFGHDVEDKLDREEKLWAIAESAQRAGMPLTEFLKRQGFTEEEIASITKAQDADMERGISVGTATKAPVKNEADAKAVQTPEGARP